MNSLLRKPGKKRQPDRIVPLTVFAPASIGNVGPGVGDVGPSENFAHFPGYVKLVLTVCMVAGRLEIFTLLALLDPHFWRD